MCVISTAGLTGAALTAAQAANAGMAMSAIGLAMSGVGTYMNQKAQNANLEYQAAINEQNAQIATEEAKEARNAAREKADRHRAGVRQFIGQQRSAASGSGMVVDEGSFLDVTLDTAEGGELDALAILHEGELEAWRKENQATNYRAQAGVNRASTSSPFMSTAPSLLTGAGQMGMNYYRLKQ